MTTSPNVMPTGSNATEGSMHAVVINQYGAPDVLEYRSMNRPSIKPDQLLIKVQASSINPIDWKIRQGMMKFLPGQKFPMILGFDIAGEVMAVGSQITRFKPGDAIYAYSDQFPGGAYAEYVAVSEKVTAPKPNTLSYEQAAAVPLAATTALQALRDQGRVMAGQKVLINGASGGVGTFAVQIAKALGAEVTAVCGTQNIELVRSLGADDVIDYKQQEFTQLPTKYNLIFDAVGKQSFSDCKSVLQPNGIYVTTQPLPKEFLQGVLTTFSSQKAKVILAKANSVDLLYLKEQIEEGKIRPVIDRTYPLAEVAEAHRYSEEGHAIGKIVITI
jgi:2-desacetyl-2-hydroxyethyl bacteriochlorophyllide A dehydrogenase